MFSRLLALFFLLADGVVLAQNVTPRAPVTPPAAPAPTTPAAAPALPATRDEMVRMQYPNTDVKEILAVYERLNDERYTGKPSKKIVYDATVQGPINIVISRDVPR